MFAGYRSKKYVSSIYITPLYKCVCVCWVYRSKKKYVSVSALCIKLAPVAEATDLPRTKSWDISLDCHIGDYRGVIRSKIVFFRISNISVPCPHKLRGRTVIKKLWTFFGTWGRDRSQSPPCWIKANPSIHGLGGQHGKHQVTSVLQLYASSHVASLLSSLVKCSNCSLEQ